MPDTLTPAVNPTWGSSVTQEHKAKSVEFGDDYEVREPRSVFSSPKREGTLTWDSLTDAQADTIETFWQNKQGYIAFYINVPEILPSNVLLVSDKLTRTPTKPGYWSIAMEVRSVPNA